VRRLAADRHRRPWDVLRGAAKVHDDLVPRHRQHVGGDAREVDARVRAEITDARLDVELAVRLQPVVANRARAVRPDRDADTAHLRSLPLAGARLALVPVEQLFAAIEPFLHEGAGDVPALAVRAHRSVERLPLG